MAKVAVITGGGSGVGKAVAAALADRNWTVALIGRTPSKIESAAAGIGRGARAYACDVADPVHVADVANRIRTDLGPAEVLVNSAGINVPRRSLADITYDDYRHTLDTNLTGAFLFAKALLPGMRELGRGTIANVISDAGLLASAKAGVAYCASKFGLAGLTQSINAEERTNGIRAVGIFPGDINTPLLDKRPVVPPPEARAKMLQPEDVAACVLLAVELPGTAVIEQLVIRPR